MRKLSEIEKETMFKLASLTVLDRAKSLHQEYYSSIKAVEVMEIQTGITADEYKTWLDNMLEQANKVWTEKFKEQTKDIDFIMGITR